MAGWYALGPSMFWPLDLVDGRTPGSDNSNQDGQHDTRNTH